MKSEEIAISVNNVSKHFLLPHEKVGSVKGLFTGILRKRNRTVEKQQALSQISFDVKRGEFFGIVGRNGSGKSTMLKMLAGIYQPNEGNVNVSGKLVPFIELGVGFNPELTGRENVYLNGALLGFTSKEIDQQYDSIVEFAELEAFMDQKLKNYSSGMQVRLAFSVATTAKADILLVDEVLAVGDADFQRKCFEYFQKLKGSDTTVIFVTHDMNAVREYCDRAILIEKSEVVASGTANEVASEYTKMFIEGGDNRHGDGEAVRWGDQALEFSNVVVPSTVKDSDEFIDISFDLVANKAVTSPLIGFILKSAAQVAVIGTNSTIEKIALPNLKAGDRKKFSIKVANVLSDGHYSLTLAAQYKGGNSTGDWWEDAATIRSYREQPTPYLVKPNIKIGVK